MCSYLLQLQGLAGILFADQPGLSLISNGAECILIDKSFYLAKCPQKVLQRLKIEVVT